jgi:DNA polymerase III epsilon subunit-like protein
MFLFFDTETTGTPKNYKASPAELDNWPRVIQLAWALFDEKQRMISAQCDLIKPSGWVMPTEKFWVDNGFTHDNNAKNGILIRAALQQFLSAMDQAPYLIAHNIDFDTPIVQAEMIRASLRTENRPTRICTMKIGTNVCRIPNRGGFKWPKLIELHTHLFNEGFEGAHDALADVKACARCFFKMLDLGHIKLQSQTA